MQGEIQKNPMLNPVFEEKDSHRNRHKKKDRERWTDIVAKGRFLRSLLKSGAIKINFEDMMKRSDVTVRITQSSMILEIPIEKIPFLESHEKK